MCASLLTAADVPATTNGGQNLKPPLPVWPAEYETITQRQPSFHLNGRYGATRYRIELARDAAFTKAMVVKDVRISAEEGICPVVSAQYAGEPLADGQYYWRAFAGDADGHWTPAANYRTFFVSAVDSDEIKTPSQVVHPRLLLSEAELPAFHERLNRSTRLGPGWQYIQNAAISMLDAVPPDEGYAKTGTGQHGRYNVVAHWYDRHLTNVAFAAFVTGDDRLASKGVRMLMAACEYDRWLGPLFDKPDHFDPPWHAALETGMMTTAVATAYDLLYPRLTDEQRAKVRAALVRNGIRPLIEDWVDPLTAARLPRHQLPNGNWVMVCASSAGIGALAVLGEEPEAANWVRLVRNRVRAWVHDRGGDWYTDGPYAHKGHATTRPVIGPSEPNFGIDGGYKESVTYMDYAVRYICCFADAHQRITGEDLFRDLPPHLLDSAAWNALAWREHGEVQSSIIPFGDCASNVAFPTLYAALTRHRQNATAAWLCERTAPIPQDICELLWLDESVPGCEPDTAIPMHAWRGIGQVVMRSGWSPDTPTAAIKFHQNRGQLDLGTFYLFGGGGPTIIDAGTAPYGSPIYKRFSSKSVGHNVVLVDGKPQARADGQLLSAVGTSRLTAASGQLAAAYPDALKSWTRDLIMLPGGLALVLDRLKGKGPHRFDYLLHPGRSLKIPYPTASPGELLIGDDERPAQVSLHSEAEFNVTEQDGWYLQNPRKYVRFDSPEPTKERSYLLVCQWPTAGPSQQRVNVSAIAPGRWQLRRVGEDWRLVVRTGDDADANDSTDARLVAVWDQGEHGRERHAIVLGGRRLGVENHELMRATRPVDAAIEFGSPLWAQVWATEPTRLSLSVEPGADYVFVNGKRAEIERRGKNVNVDLPAGESLIVAGETPRYIPRPRSVRSDDLLPVPAATNAPAYQKGILAKSSSCISEALQAIDGDANTSWKSLPGQAMPQWVEVILPKPQTVARVKVQPGSPCKGHIETWDTAAGKYKSQGDFATTAAEPTASVDFTSAKTDRLRVVVDEIEPPIDSASIRELNWQEE